MPSVDNDVLNCFSRAVTSIINRVESNKTDFRSLATLHDTLLPKLVSGKLKVDVTARPVQEAI